MVTKKFIEHLPEPKEGCCDECEGERYRLVELPYNQVIIIGELAYGFCSVECKEKFKKRWF